jgi:hypothetical protein
MVISLIYWPLVILCPQLILQLAAAEVPQTPTRSAEISFFVRIPLPVDLALHATPSLSILADFFLFESKYQRKDIQVGAPITTAAFGLWYGFGGEHCGKINGVCEYKVILDSYYKIYSFHSSVSLFDRKYVSRSRRDLLRSYFTRNCIFQDH